MRTRLLWLLFLVLAVVSFTAPLIISVLLLLHVPIPYWLNTPDDPDPATQGLSEPSVKWWDDHFGQGVRRWIWLGWRNRFNGLSWLLADKADASAHRFLPSHWPREKDPYTPGSESALLLANGQEYMEHCSVMPMRWFPSRCTMIRVGWKIAEMDDPATSGRPVPILWVCQYKPFLRIR